MAGMATQEVSIDTTDGEVEPVIELKELAVGSLQPHPRNVRTAVGDVSDLAASIKAKGVIHPLVVVPATAKGKYRIVAGHRRHAAAKEAGVKRVPCVVRRDLDDEADQLASMLSENIERADLTPLEEASAVQGLLELGDTQAQIVARTGMAKKRVADRVKIAKLGDAVKEQIATHALSLDEALFVAKYADNDEDREYLERHMGTTNWAFAKAKVVEWAARRRKHEKWRREIADAGLTVVNGLAELTAWRKDHGFTGVASYTVVSWTTRGDRPLDPDTCVVVLTDHMNVPDLLDHERAAAPADDERDAGQSDSASTSGTAGEPAANSDGDAVPSKQERDKVLADLETAATVRAKVIHDAVAMGQVDDETVVLALRLTAKFLRGEGVLDEQDLDLLELDPERFDEMVDRATSWKWLVMVIALAERGTCAHLEMKRGWFHDADTGWMDLFERLGHVWSDVERPRVERARDEAAALANEETAEAEAAPDSDDEAPAGDAESGGADE